MLRIAGVLLVGVAMLGFVNAFVLRLHGPGGDLGVIAGILGIGALGLGHRLAKP